MKTVKQKEKEAYTAMKSVFGYKNPLAAPHLMKVVIASGTGTLLKKDKHKNDFIIERLAKITGQRAVTKRAKKSIAQFKLRQGDPVGVMVTIRGARMYGFLDKYFNVALPRTKDFRGVDAKIVDSMGNATIAVKEHTIFPETADEELKDVFGFAMTIVTSAKTKEEAKMFLELIGIPFKK